MLYKACNLASYTRRQESRQELKLETILERQPEGAELLGGEFVAPAAVVNLEQSFRTPIQRTMAAQAVDNRFPEFAWLSTRPLG